MLNILKDLARTDGASVEVTFHNNNYIVTETFEGEKIYSLLASNGNLTTNNKYAI
jgi:antitoxin component of MazEF toxin-antitoxin module